MAVINEKATISARINSAAVRALKNLKVPLSDVIEAGVFHFLFLDDFAKVKFLIQNNEDVVNLKTLEATYRENKHKSWPDIVKDSLRLEDDTDAKAVIKELKSVAKNLDNRGEEVFFKKRIAGLNTSALLQEAHLLMLKSAFPEALLLYESALRLFETESNDPEAGKTLALIGRCHQYLGRNSDALDAFEKARRIIEQHNLPHELANLLYNRGTCYQMTGKYDEACTSFTEACQIYESLGNYEEVRKSLSSMGACLSFMGDKKRVLELYDMFVDRILQQKQLLVAAMSKEK